jgi:UDP-N-acetylmuramoyl-tripeptide--D-alanyl-D-alanine ligase
MDGALFIALCGDNFDAHDYVKQAQKMGAVALLVSKKVKSSLSKVIGTPRWLLRLPLVAKVGAFN